MITDGVPAVHEAGWEDNQKSNGSNGTPTIGWFVRRSALWAGIVALAVASACALYALAGGAGAETEQPGPQAAKQRPLRI